MDIPEAVIDRIKKLLRLGESSNQHEAALAAARATELMLKYQIDQASINASEQDEPIDSYVFGAGGGCNRQRWKGSLAHGIASAFGCKIWWQGTMLMFVGRKSDLQTVQYMFQYLSKEIERLADSGWENEGIYSGYHGKAWKNSFYVGCSHAIALRVCAQRKATFQEVEQKHEPGTSTALMVLQNQERAVDQYYEQLHLRKGNPLRATSRSGLDAGVEAGKNVNIGGGTALNPGKKQLR